MVLPVNVYTPFSRTETEGVRVEAGEEYEGVEVDGAMLAEEGERGRSGKRALERVVVVESSDMAVASSAAEGVGEGEDSVEEVETRSGAEEEYVGSEPEPEKMSGGEEDEKEEEEGWRAGWAEEPREGKEVSRESGSMGSWEEQEEEEEEEDEDEAKWE